MSKLYVDELHPKTSGNKFIIPPAGGIIQTQYTQFTGTNTVSLTVDTDVVFSDLTVKITPASSSSIIKVEAHVVGEFATSGNIYNTMWMFHRDSTRLAHPTAGSRLTGITTLLTNYAYTDAGSTLEAGNITYFDKPNTTSEITYKVVAYNSNTTGNFMLNRTVTDTNSDAYERGISYISVTEIAG